MQARQKVWPHASVTGSKNNLRHNEHSSSSSSGATRLFLKPAHEVHARQRRVVLVRSFVRSTSGRSGIRSPARLLACSLSTSVASAARALRSLLEPVFQLASVVGLGSVTQRLLQCLCGCLVLVHLQQCSAAASPGLSNDTTRHAQH